MFFTSVSLSICLNPYFSLHKSQLLLAFDYGDLEEFQQYFSLLDVDNSGDLSGREVRVLLKALDINVRVDQETFFSCNGLFLVLYACACLVCRPFLPLLVNYPLFLASQISELKFNQLLQTVDLNGNGTIEFDEYCWMVSFYFYF